MDGRSKFVTPSTLDSLRYARIECNEGADIELRERLPEHARNNGRNHTVRSELAQVVMLLLTALPDASLFSVAEASGTMTMDRLCHEANMLVIYAIDGYGWKINVCICDLLLDIARHPGVEVEADLRQCWSALAWKHASQHMSGYPEELK
jgi:hypothetical protein